MQFRTLAGVFQTDTSIQGFSGADHVSAISKHDAPGLSRCKR
jgi:hypothetical protein